MKVINYKIKTNFLIWGVVLLVCATAGAQPDLHTIEVKSPAELQSFFKHTDNDIVLIAGHRGGMVKGFPENSIATFENTLKHIPAFFEIDPRLTKDSIVVLMHDATLDRTTTGKGKLSDYTYEDIKQLKLKDPEGNVTEYSVPTLSEVIEWARGKTILNLDHKDLPLAMAANIIQKHKAEAFVMLTVHKAEEARFYLNFNKNSMFSAFIRTKKEFEEYEDARIPFGQMIAYIGPLVKLENQELYTLLNKKGTMCMISAASSYDKLKTAEERKAAYQAIVKDGASVLETDFPIEAADAIQELINKKSPKSKFFGKTK